MANFLSTPPLTATDGERAFYNRIKSVFIGEDHILGYFEPNIGGLHPDFLFLSPKYGVLIVEIKDYSEKYLKTMSKTGKWERLKHEKTVLIDNPFDQIHQYWRVIKDRINHCHFPEGTNLPVLSLVAFSQISQDGYVAEEIRKLSPMKIHLCFKETLSRNEKFKEFINDILPLNFALSDEKYKILRANIIPSCRLPSLKQKNLLKYFNCEDKVKLLEAEQEKFAGELGEGHRLIFGVAGSGKTVILIARARILAKRHPNWRILILCYNKLLRKLIFNMINPLDYEADITISTFHGWARNSILSADDEFSLLYREAEEKAKKEDKKDDFFQEFVPKLFLQMLKTQGANHLSYDAILIDEAQDFEQVWFEPIMEVLNPDTNSLLITCDGLQGIYARKRFTWASVGIQARGRVKRFEKSYRIPIEIGILAQKVLPKNITTLIDQFDEFISTKQFIGNHGQIEIFICEDREDEYEKLAEKISRSLKNPQEILILFKLNMKKLNYKHPFFEHLKNYNIEWKDLQDYNYKSPGLLIGTLHGTKGLESETIIIPELDTYNSNQDRQLLYVGITRSKKKLVLSANKSTKLIKSLESNQDSESI